MHTCVSLPLVGLTIIRMGGGWRIDRVDRIKLQDWEAS